VDSPEIELELDLDRFEFPQAGIDRDGGHLHDRTPRLRATRFEVQEDNTFVW
jgi:hypothetical protein